ncbi:SDR family NAD(P)-dependent oxidoreductase [Qaidamihabitans albus]|uniref:SDR family NAD(P)-dependent oxidoreductase n=1 Tax=Qaidamihabitans albus TaxID=2795733 RepID=UPI0018F193DB|nr:SDR family NAD(P)-dependent oxidoreductase [Qaidamihabitans albus]
MRELHGKVAVITGAASGIGLALARACVAEGMSIVLADVESARLDTEARKLRDEGATVLAVPTDVSDSSSVDELAEAAGARFGRVHLVCNNAGVGPGGVTWEVSEQIWKWVLDVDLWGVVHGIRAFVPQLVGQSEGHVVNTSSVTGLVGSPGMAAYSAAKHAVVGLSQSLRHDLELAGSPVGVSVVCPGMTRTRMNDSGRNWPADQLGQPPETGLEPSHPDTRDSFYQRMEVDSMDPAEVATQTLDAVRMDRFWVIPDASILSRLDAEVEAVRRAASTGDRAPRHVAADTQGSTQ